MTTNQTIHFAQLSDIHISSLGDRYDMLSGRAADFLRTAVAALNGMADLDFVLISGDLFDTASHWELEQFEQAISALNKPRYIIPGNHDRRDADQPEGLTRRDFARRFNPQFAARPARESAQAGYWSVEVHPQVQLIGLDSIIDGDWRGEIDAPQLAWLEAELARCAHKTVLLAVHHPLHKLAPIDDEPGWTRFVLTNGPDVLHLLDAHPQVKLVLTGHHHVTRADWLGRRLHLACPALVIYPCAFRTLRISLNDGGGVQADWQTHAATDAAVTAESRARMVQMWREVGFSAEFVAGYAAIALGSDVDRRGSAQL